MRIGSLFSGIGGIELGFEREGFETAWFVEYSEYQKAVLKKHWPGATIYGDIKEVDFNNVPPIDILTGGFPCQDISQAGKRAGIKGHRSSLWKYFAEAIRILRPKYAVIENVSAATLPIKEGGRIVDAAPIAYILRDLATLGYDAEWHCIPASSIGAPHRRDRIFVIAYTQHPRHDGSRGRGSTEKEYAEGRLQEPQGCDSASTSLSKDDMADTHDLRCLDCEPEELPDSRGGGVTA